MMRRLAFVLTLVIALPACTQRYVVADGSWTSNETWSFASCGVATGAPPPTATDEVILCPGVTVTIPCNTAAVALGVSDDPSFASTSTGGLSADESACARGQVSSLTLSRTGTAASGVHLDGMGKAGSFVLKGKLVGSGYVVPAVSDLTAQCPTDGSGTTCLRFSYASDPWSSHAPPISDFRQGDIVWFDSGQYRNNFWRVDCANSGGACNSSTDLYLRPGPTDDYAGSQNGYTPSLYGGRDVTVTTITTTNPTRIAIGVASGTLPDHDGDGPATGTHELKGSCLVSPNGNYYRIAMSYDGGASDDTLILDPWATIAGSDATGSGWWIAPCVRPGDLFEVFEPFIVKPATPGTNISSMAFLNGAAPTLQYVAMPDAGDGYNTSADAPFSLLGFKGQDGVTVGDHIAIGPARGINRGYGVTVECVRDFTLQRLSVQGVYIQGSGPTIQRFHGLEFHDVNGFMLSDANFSFFNNEGIWADTVDTVPDDCTAAGYTEGEIALLDGISVHDVWSGSNEAASGDSGGGINILGYQHVDSVPTRFVVRDSTAWNTEFPMAVMSLAGSGNYVLAYDNVFGYPRPAFDDPNGPTVDATCAGTGTEYHANEVFLPNPPATANLSAGGALDCAGLYYSWMGEQIDGVRVADGGSWTHEVIGLLIDAGGPTSSMVNGIHHVTMLAASPAPANLKIRDLLIRRLCGYQGGTTPIRGILFDSGGSGARPVRALDLAYMTFGLMCPEALTASPALGAGIVFASDDAGSDLAVGSSISDLLCLSGDGAGPGAYQASCLVGTNGMTGDTNTDLPLARVLCSNCTIGASECQRTCVRNPPSDTSVLNPTESLDFETLSDPIAAIGVVAGDDPRCLSLNGPLFSVPGSTQPSAARYAGIVRYSRAMRDMAIPEDFVRFKATPDSQPDPSLLPADLRFLLDQPAP